MITLHCKLTFENEKDKKQLIELMRKFSSCYRYAYNRLLEGQKRKDLKKHLQNIFNLNSRYCDDAIFKAQSLINSYRERGQNPEKVIFGGGRLFELLKNKHINGEKREELKRKWKERRQGCLYSRGDKTKKGNLNIRVILEKDSLKLRINTSSRNWITANIKRTVTRQNDKWIQFISKLLQAQQTKEYFPYSVEIRLINSQIYAFISFEEELPKEPTITKEERIIGIDINASPFHIALATIKPDGNLQAVNKISLHKLINRTKNQREYLSWEIAHQIVETAILQNKAIAIEKLKDMPKGTKGDGNKKLRKKLQQWIYKGLFEKIKAIAKRKAVQVMEVNPAYTSVVGALKYAPQYSLDKDIAGAFVIGRKALGFKEKLPKNYEKLITDKEYQKFAIERLTEEKQKTQEKLKTENNKYKKKPLKRKMKDLNKQIKLLKSLYSKPQTQEAVNQWKEQMRGLSWTSYTLWLALKVALAFPILGKSLNRDLSPLRSLIISGDWDRIVRRLAPVSWDRGYDVDKCRQLGTYPHLNRRDTNTPAQSVVSFLHSG